MIRYGLWCCVMFWRNDNGACSFDCLQRIVDRRTDVVLALVDLKKLLSSSKCLNIKNA